ncbi:hypothetical protein [Leptospira paudalimensis]|uniref:Lipoprotein n=1 Tax=Leptospira paudalimensis TaxID=2950024 RepID=A0ABT3MA99_9LEPT|nr:hypothetical protein [Leptospira paudalimensis]MCW7505312.1 hypothetical protein [Leptospira paudalimensis]
MKDFTLMFLKLTILFLSILISNCDFSKRLVKNDVDAKFVYYNLDCILLKEETLNCKVLYDLEHEQFNNLSLNEAEIILLLYNILFQVSFYGKELGFEYGKITKWELRLNTLKNNPVDSFEIQLLKSVELTNIQGFSYHLAINKPFPLQDAIDTFQNIESRYNKIQNPVRKPVIDAKINLAFKYKIQSFIRQSAYYNNRYRYVSNQIFNECKTGTIDISKKENIIYTEINIKDKTSNFNYMDEITPKEKKESSRFIKFQSYPSEIIIDSNEESERIIIKEEIQYSNLLISIESNFPKKHKDCYIKKLDNFIFELFNQKD